MSTPTVEVALRARLLEHPTVVQLVGDRISPHTRDQDPEALPAITYERLDTVENVTLEGPTGSGRAPLQIDAWASTADQAVELALAVGDALRAGAGTGVNAAFRRTQAGPTQDPEVKVFRVRMVWDVHYSAAVAA